MEKRARVFKILKWVAISVVAFMLILSALLLIFKDNIKEYALEEVNQYLNKRVHIGYMDVGVWKSFPNMTLSFDDVLVYSKFDTLQTVDTAVYAQKLKLKFNVLDFFRGQYSVHKIEAENSILNLAVLEDGRINYDFIKDKEDSVSTPFEFNLKKIDFNNTEFSYSNEATQQFYSGFFENLKLKGSFNEKQFVLGARTNFDVHSIRNQSITLFENQSAKCNIKVQMDQVNKIFEIKSADLTINKLPFNIKGKVSQDSLNFYIGSKDLDLADVANKLTFSELDVVKKINGKGKVNFDLFIKGAQDRTTASAMNATFEVKDGSLSDKDFSLSKINLKGSYSNGILDGKEQIHLSNLAFFTLNENFDGNLTVTNFAKPKIVGKAHGKVDLRALHRLFGPFNLQELTGSIDVNGNFNLQFNNPQVKPTDITIFDLKTRLLLDNIKLKFIDDLREIEIKKGDISLQNQIAKVEDLEINLNQSSLTFNGDFNHISDYLSGKQNLYVNAQVNSPSLFINDLSSSTPTEEKTKDWVLPENISGTIQVNLQNVEYFDHQYSDISGKMNFEKHQLNFPSISGVNAGAKVSGGLVIRETQPKYLVVETTLNAPKIDFKNLFEEWNNFDQTVITSKNIEGNASVYLYFKGPFDLYNEKIVKEEFHVLSRIKISKGTLKDVQSFKEITSSLRKSAAKLLLSKSRINEFEKRLLNLEFDSFENEFTIENGIITIPQMTIKSNALDLNLEGIHTFENQIDYSFNFRFRELKGNQDSEFGEIVDDGTGFKIYMKMTGDLSNPTITWDKESKQLEKQAQKEQAKEDLKSAFKTGFGFNKNDSTVKTLDQNEKKEDQIIMDFGNDEEEEIEKKPKKEKKGLGKKFDEWNKDKKKEEQPEFEIE